MTLGAIGVVDSPPAVVPRYTLYEVAPVDAVQLSVAEASPAAAVRLLGAAGAPDELPLDEDEDELPLEDELDELELDDELLLEDFVEMLMAVVFALWLPASSYALTAYEYVVSALRPVS